LSALRAHRDIGMLREHVLDLARKAVIQYAAASRLSNNSLWESRAHFVAATSTE